MAYKQKRRYYFVLAVYTLCDIRIRGVWLADPSNHDVITLKNFKSNSRYGTRIFIVVEPLRLVNFITITVTATRHAASVKSMKGAPRIAPMLMSSPCSPPKSNAKIGIMVSGRAVPTAARREPAAAWETRISFRYVQPRLQRVRSRLK